MRLFEKKMLFRPVSIAVEPLLEEELKTKEEGEAKKEVPQKRYYYTFLLIALLIITLAAVIFCLSPVSLWFRRLGSVESSMEKYVDHKMNVLFPELKEEFEEFERNFKREWKSAEERLERYENFVREYQSVKRLNRIGRITNTSYEINQFADWSQEEFKNFLLPLDHYKKIHASGSAFVRRINPILEMGAIMGVSYPEYLDWRDKGVVTPVKNQKKCGSCWAFATAATVESAYAVAHGELRSLSEQELLDCNLENNACNGGDVDKAFRFVHENGLMYEDAYPYVAHRQNSCRLEERGETTKIDVAYFLRPDEQSIIDWLVNFGPVNVGISVTSTMKPYKSGVYRPSDYSCKYDVVGLHALLVVGYGRVEETGEKYWIIKNSWGQDWGTEHGYVHYARGVNACGVEDEPIGLLA